MQYTNRPCMLNQMRLECVYSSYMLACSRTFQSFYNPSCNIFLGPSICPLLSILIKTPSVHSSVHCIVEISHTEQSFLDYFHLLSIAFCYLGLLCYGFFTSKNLAYLDAKRKQVPIFLMVVIASSYLAEALSYAYTEHNRPVPQHAMVHVISAALEWVILAIILYTAEDPAWIPYLGTFITETVFQIIFCLTTRLFPPMYDYLDVLYPSLNIIRTIGSIVWVGNWIVIVRPPWEARHTDEEASPLLRNTGNYNARNRQDSSWKNNWKEYKSSFRSLLPYLWPKDDKRYTFWVAVRVGILVVDRFLKIAIPYQLGIIADEIKPQSGNIPWKDIALWIGYRWLASSFGLQSIDDWASAYTQASSYQRITVLAFTHIMNLSMDFHTDNSPAEVVKAADQAQSLNDLIEIIIFQIVPMLVDLVIAMAYVMRVFGIYMALVVIAVFVAYFWLSVVISAWTKPKRRVWVEECRMMIRTATESISLYRSVSSFNRIKYECIRFQKVILSTTKTYLDYMYHFYKGKAIQDVVTECGYAVGVFVAVWQIVCGQNSMGTFVTFLMCWGTITKPVKTITHSYQSINNKFVDAERLFQLLNTKATVIDTEESKELTVGPGKIVFQDVDFSYDDRKPVLRRVSFIAEPGKTVALVGLSGGGKSTILDLISRFYDAKRGSITIDGQDVCSVTLSSLRAVLGVVPHNPALFNQSILENVRFGRLNATQQEIEEACRGADIHKDIISLPDGYQSRAGEKGVKMSGGQLQRIAIARVLLANPKIILLDEATSAVDVKTEENIRSALERLISHRTTLVVAHRLCTVVRADMILVVENGEIIERGTHDELLKEEGKYAEFWEKQTSVPGKVPSK